jgi:hypothetical protein
LRKTFKTFGRRKDSKKIIEPLIDFEAEITFTYVNKGNGSRRRRWVKLKPPLDGAPGFDERKMFYAVDLADDDSDVDNIKTFLYSNVSDVKIV